MHPLPLQLLPETLSFSRLSLHFPVACTGAAVGASAVIGARFVLESYLDGEEALG